MKRKIILLVLLLALLVTSPCFASVGVKSDGVLICQATDINFSSANTITSDGSVATVAMTTTGLVGAITSGTINGAIIGGSNPAAGHFTTLDSTGVTTLGDAIGDIVTFTGKIAGATPLSFDGATANTVYTILAVDDPASSSKTVTLPAVTGTIKLTGAAVALTPGAAVALTVAKGTTLYTDTPTDNEDQTITFSGAGSAGDEVTIIFTCVGTADEVITFHATLVSSTGTLTCDTTAARYYVIRFISNGSHWYEVSRTAVQT